MVFLKSAELLCVNYSLRIIIYDLGHHNNLKCIVNLEGLKYMRRNGFKCLFSFSQKH